MNNRLDLLGLPVGNHRMPCPECQRGAKDRALSVTVDSAAAVWHCFRCGVAGRTVASHVKRKPHVRPPTNTVPGVHDCLSPYGQRLWEQSRRLAGEAVAYLQARNCVIPPPDGDLRWQPNLRHPSGYEGPALVGLITDAITNAPLSLHRTWIQPSGQKAAVQGPRLLLKAHRKAGGVIRLWPDEAVTLGLGVAEGIETALSAAHAFTPVWSCIDSGNLGRLPVLPGIVTLSIFADNDSSGLAGAGDCRRRWLGAGTKVRLVVPPRAGTDFNDILMRGAA